MIIRRIIWAIVILSAGIMYLFDNETVTLAVLLTVAAAPLVSALLLLACPGISDLQLEQIDQQDQKSPTGIALKVKKKGVLPIAALQFTVRAENLHTRRSETHYMEMSLSGRRVTEKTFPVDLRYAGKYEVHVRTERILDPLRIFKRRMVSEADLQVTVYPSEAPMHVELSGSAAAMLDSDRYSEKKRGNDPGEVRSIYEYQPGDPVKNIHWKLSEKLDKLLVKELGMPVADPMLVLLGPAGQEDPAAADTVLSVFASVLRALHDAEVNCSAGWQSEDGSILQVRKIREEDDLRAAAEEYLGVPAQWDRNIQSLWGDAGNERFAHLVIACDQRPEGIEYIVEGCQITLLQYGFAGSIRDDGGVSVIGYDRDSWRQTLAEIEV